MFPECQFQKPEKKVYFPHEVVAKSVVEEKGLIRAWREYKGILQEEEEYHGNHHGG
jgi:hypothetical protein